MRTRLVPSASQLIVALLATFVLCRVVAAEDAPAATALPQGVSQEALDELQTLLEQTKTRAAIVLHKGRPIAEWYWLDANAESVFEVWSTSKSYASTCIGLLIDEKKIDSIDDKVSKYVPSWGDGDKAKVTIAHLLDQNSGLEEGGNFFLNANQLQTALDAKIITPPGEVSKYNNAGCNVLSAIISAASGQDPETYMREKVWKPLGMEHTSWRKDKAGNVITYAGVQSTARDLSRFGQMLLERGQWEGKRIVSTQWLDLATNARTKMTTIGDVGIPYGLLWWVDFKADAGVPHNFSALGLFGNNLTVIPSLDLVGVRLVGSHSDGGSLMMRTPEWVEKLSKVVIQPSAENAAASNN